MLSQPLPIKAVKGQPLASRPSHPTATSSLLRSGHRPSPFCDPPQGQLYSLSAVETRAMEEYVAKSHRQGTIRTSNSLAAAGFFFIKKMDGSLRPRAQSHHGEESPPCASLGPFSLQNWTCGVPTILSASERRIRGRPLLSPLMGTTRP